MTNWLTISNAMYHIIADRRNTQNFRCVCDLDLDIVNNMVDLEVLEIEIVGQFANNVLFSILNIIHT